MIGVFSDREYHVRWSASSYTGGLPVNYSIKLCLNTSMENETSCKILNLDDLDCRPENVLRTDFLCVLKKPGDFISGYGKTYNYTISVVAENAVGSAKSSRYVPYVRNYLGNFVFLACACICVCNMAILWPANRLTEACSLGLQHTSLILDILDIQ